MMRGRAMTHAVMLLAVVLLDSALLGQAATADKPAPPATQPEVSAAEIDRLIKQLGSEKFAERDLAQRTLVKIGLPAVPALRAASADTNPERAQRAKQALASMVHDLLERLVFARFNDRQIEEKLFALGEPAVRELLQIVVQPSDNHELLTRALFI